METVGRQGYGTVRSGDSWKIGVWYSEVCLETVGRQGCGAVRCGDSWKTGVWYSEVWRQLEDRGMVQ